MSNAPFAIVKLTFHTTGDDPEDFEEACDFFDDLSGTLEDIACTKIEDSKFKGLFVTHLEDL